jgi:CRP-like cAMP-binding protein
MEAGLILRVRYRAYTLEAGRTTSVTETVLDSAPRSPNGFLSSLAADDFELIRPHLRTVDLVQEFVLVEAGETLKRAYLPHTGVISLIVRLAKGETVQIAMVGRDSIFGSCSALGDPTALNGAVVLVPGVASTLDIERLKSAADQSATFRATLGRHGMAVYAQIQQTAGCNVSHTVESRLARCLLQTHDLSGSDRLVLTQESMAQMIGARRNSVSLVANALQQANFIHYRRGHIEINNLSGLSKTACECYATVKSQYERLLWPDRTS